jgi:hypothetical protein
MLVRAHYLTITHSHAIQIRLALEERRQRPPPPLQGQDLRGSIKIDDPLWPIDRLDSCVGGYTTSPTNECKPFPILVPVREFLMWQEVHLDRRQFLVLDLSCFFEQRIDQDRRHLIHESQDVLIGHAFEFL